MKDILGNEVVPGDTVIVAGGNVLCPGIVIREKTGCALIRRMTSTDLLYIRQIEANPRYYNYLTKAISIPPKHIIRVPLSILPEEVKEDFNNFIHVLKVNNYIK